MCGTLSPVSREKRRTVPETARGTPCPALRNGRRPPGTLCISPASSAPMQRSAGGFVQARPSKLGHGSGSFSHAGKDHGAAFPRRQAATL